MYTRARISCVLGPYLLYTQILRKRLKTEGQDRHDLDHDLNDHYLNHYLDDHDLDVALFG